MAQHRRGWRGAKSNRHPILLKPLSLLSLFFWTLTERVTRRYNSAFHRSERIKSHCDPYHRFRGAPARHHRGVTIFNQQLGTFEFQPGPVFVNLLLADEINRATPRTQAALLEATQERQVTVDGHTHPLTIPFLVHRSLEPTPPDAQAELDDLTEAFAAARY
ncbi:MAG: AAA family ATPase, partial [Ardenticatenales bacterium]|nr:AAA family ATPase [Ardenticatenales bacterium]